MLEPGKEIKKLWLVELAKMGFFEGWSDLSSGFRLVLILNRDQMRSEDDFRAFVESAQKRGVRWIFCAGNGAQYLHDLCDWEIATQSVDADDEALLFVLTTWHETDPLDQVLWEACNLPDDTPFHDIVVVGMKGDSRLLEIRELAQDLHRTFEEVLNRDDDSS